MLSSSLRSLLMYLAIAIIISLWHLLLLSSLVLIIYSCTDEGVLWDDESFLVVVTLENTFYFLLFPLHLVLYQIFSTTVQQCSGG